MFSSESKIKLVEGILLWQNKRYKNTYNCIRESLTKTIKTHQCLTFLFCNIVSLSL